MAQSVRDEFERIRYDMVKAFLTPIRVTFSLDGYNRARMQATGGEFYPVDRPATHYEGLLFTVVDGQEEDILLHSEPAPPQKRILQIVDFFHLPEGHRNKYRIVETTMTIDGPRNRLSSQSFATKEAAEERIAEIT